MPTKLPPPPKLVEVLTKDIPEQMMNDIEDNLEKLMKLPVQIDEDLATLVLIASKQPEKVADTLYNMPGSAPKDVDNLLDTIREGFEYEGDEESRGERLRRITDVIDLFTPT